MAAAAVEALRAVELKERLKFTSELGRNDKKGKAPTETQKAMQDHLEVVMHGESWLHALEVQARIASRRGLQGPWNRMEAIGHCLHINGEGTVLPKSEWEKVGRTVKPECKGFQVWIPSVSRREVTSVDENGDEETKVVTKKFINKGGHNGNGRYYDVTETDGPGVWTMQWADQAKSVTGASLSEDERFLSNMRSAADHAGCTVEERPASRMFATEIGHIEHVSKHIVVRDDMTPAAKAATIAHELGHHFDPFLAKNEDDPFARAKDYQRYRDECEFVAESVAYAVSSQYDVDTGETTAEYLHSWRPTRAGQAKNLYERCNDAMDQVLAAADPEKHARWQDAA